MAFELAASAEMLFVDLAFLERVHRIDDLGFQVEIWDWSTKDPKGCDAPGRPSRR